MSFDEIKSIWDSQDFLNDSQNDTELLSAVKTWDRSFRRMVGITDFLMISCLLFVAAMFFRDPLLQGHDRVLMIPGLACLLAAGLAIKWRYDRKTRQQVFDDSLLGLVNRSIDGINDRIARTKSFLLWFAVPNAIGLAIALWIVADSKRYLFYYFFVPGFVACIGLAYWQFQRENKRTLVPHRQRLEALRRKLVETEATNV